MRRCVCVTDAVETTPNPSLLQIFLNLLEVATGLDIDGDGKTATAVKVPEYDPSVSEVHIVITTIAGGHNAGKTYIHRVPESDHTHRRDITGKPHMSTWEKKSHVEMGKSHVNMGFFQNAIFPCQHAIFFPTWRFEKIPCQHGAPFPDVNTHTIKTTMLRRSSPPVLSPCVSTRVFTLSIETGIGRPQL